LILGALLGYLGWGWQPLDLESIGKSSVTRHVTEEDS
jgi:hypothetical protein